jgi:hypothetical protein
VFDSVVFAGGGCRCFWQLGLWSVAGAALDIRPRVATGVSAGAAMACVALLGRCEETLRRFKAATARNPKNVYPENLLRGGRVFPHHAMYREAILHAVDAAGLERLRTGPTDLGILLACAPRGLGTHLSLLLGLGCYVVEKRFGDPVHSELAHRVGFAAELVSARSCRTPSELADLILASSCTPPFTPAMRRGGRPVLDGSLVDCAPLATTTGRTLVLLSRSYGRTPEARADRVYLGPSEPIAVSKWDYTSPDALQRAYDLGRRDGEAFVRRAGGDP